MTFQKGDKITLGRKRTEEEKRKISETLKGKCSFEKSCHWKGDNISYSSMHRFLNKHFKKPKLCESCKEPRKLDLANVTGIYNRDLKNYKYLCRTCHVNLDNIALKAWVTRKGLHEPKIFR